MPEPMTILILCGSVVLLAPVLILAGTRRVPLKLGDAVDAVVNPGAAEVSQSATASHIGPLDRWMSWLAGQRVATVPRNVHRTLALQGRSLNDFTVERCVWAGGGVLIPVLVQVLPSLGMGTWTIPVLASLVAGVTGWFVPLLRLRSARVQVQQDAVEAILTFVDLVTLARLANQSSTKSLWIAGGISDHSVLVRIRSSLERSRLEQKPPWSGLEALAGELDLPQLAELTEVLRLDDQGASLAQVLRARVADMRDAHLTREKVAA